MDSTAHIEAMQQLVKTMADTNQTEDVKKAAIQAVTVPPPSTWAANTIWIILVAGIVGLLVLAILGLTHVIGHDITDTTLTTIFSSLLAGLLGLFAKAPTS